jgi:hypothetical protein
VLLESCHSGHWRGADGMRGISGGGRTIVTTSAAEKSAWAQNGDGLYSSAWKQCSSDEDNDSNNDGAVSPGEAHACVMAAGGLPQGPGFLSSLFFFSLVPPHPTSVTSVPPW